MTTPPTAGEEAAAPRLEDVWGTSTPSAGHLELESPPAQAVWEAPVYDFNLHNGVSYSSRATREDHRHHGIIRTARWCVDGSTILTTSEDRKIRLYLTGDHSDSSSSSELKPYLTLPQAAPVLSSLWYPTASPAASEGFCFAAAIRDAPVRLIDAATGLIRATYPIVDHRERFIAPYSMAWNPSATKLYCGHENAIEVVDISAPGYDTAERIKTSLTRGDKGGQKGIISALAFSTDYSGLYAAGSFGGSVSMYSEDESGAVGHLEGVVGGGVTQLAFHPLSPDHLFVASRRSSKLQVFDLRNPSEPFHSFPRSAGTNQRMSFDLDPWGRWVAVGDERGKVGIWDVAGGGQWGEIVWEGQVANDEDAISSVQFHPLKPSLLVSSGSRHVDLHIGLSDSESDSGSDDGSSVSGDEGAEEDGITGAEGGKKHGAGLAVAKQSRAGTNLGVISFQGASLAA